MALRRRGTRELELNKGVADLGRSSLHLMRPRRLRKSHSRTRASRLRNILKLFTVTCKSLYFRTKVELKGLELPAPHGNTVRTVEVNSCVLLESGWNPHIAEVASTEPGIGTVLFTRGDRRSLACGGTVLLAGTSVRATSPLPVLAGARILDGNGGMDSH